MSRQQKIWEMQNIVINECFCTWELFCENVNAQETVRTMTKKDR